MTHLRSHARLASITVLGALAVIGCGSGGDEGASGIGAGNLAAPSFDGPGTPGSGEIPAGTGATTMFDGEWLRPCTADVPGSTDAGHTLITLSIDGTAGTQRLLHYDDSACSVPARVAERVAEYSLVYPGTSTDTPLGPALHVDTTMRRFIFDGVPSPVPGGAARGFDILLVADDRLYSGDIDTNPEQDGESMEGRPTTLADEPYVRQ